MSRYQITKYMPGTYEPQTETVSRTIPHTVHRGDHFNKAEEFVHATLPNHPDCLYVIRGESMNAAYRMVEGNIVCKPFTASVAA